LPIRTRTLRNRQVLLGRYLELFSGREDCFARQWVDKKQNKQGYVPVRRPMEHQDLEEHFKGVKTYGMYLLKWDGGIKTAVMDVDLGKDFRAKRLTSDEKNRIKREYHYLIERIAELSEQAGLRPLIEFSGGKVTDKVPVDGLKRLMLVGYVSLSGGVLDFLIQQRVETVFVTPSRRFRARLLLDEHRHVTLRTAQYHQLADERIALKTAGAIVRGKIANMYRFLLIRARQYQDDVLRRAAVRLKAMEAGARTARNFDTLRGMEGAAARVYYGVFRNLIRNESFIFNGRNRRPPLDPVNALLSFVYTLLTNEVLSAIKSYGLDPYLGSLHDVSYGRPSLAYDLVEEYRSFLGDRLVLGLINRKAVKPDDFVYRKLPPVQIIDEQEMKSKRPVEMKPAIRRAFVSAYEEMMKRRIFYEPLGKTIEYRRLIQNQVRQFGKYLENPENDYRPFVWEN